MITIGVDCHKENHTLVAVDAVGRPIAQLAIPNRPSEYPKVCTWAAALDQQRLWGIENSGSFGYALAQYLLNHQEPVYEVSPHLTGRKRRTSLDAQKSDPADARAIARIVLQEETKLPKLHPQDLSSVLKVAVEHRDNLIGQRTQLLNQLHMHLTHIEPGYQERLGSLQQPAALQACVDYPMPSEDPVAQMRIPIIQQIAHLILSLTDMIQHIETDHIQPMVQKTHTPLLSIQGIGLIAAAKLMAYADPIHTIKSAATLARYSGIAPIERSSGPTLRHRVDGQGNRQLQAVFYMIALTQKRCNPLAQAYLAKKRREGKTNKEAMRCLMRRLVDIIYAVWKHNQPYRPPVQQENAGL